MSSFVPNMISYLRHSVTSLFTGSCRNSLTNSPMYYFAAGYAADVDGVNYTAVCESRGGICTRAADCETNSAVDLTGTGSRFRSSYVADSAKSDDQIRSFLCNLTSICCLPQPTSAGSLHGRDEIILGIPMGPVGPMRFPWEWESLG